MTSLLSFKSLGQAMHVDFCRAFKFIVHIGTTVLVMNFKQHVDMVQWKALKYLLLGELCTLTN